MIKNKNWFNRALQKSELKGECLIFNGTTTTTGHGQIWNNDKMHYLHRLSYERSKGKIPEGLIVRHTCDTPNCWNPDHLLIGTPLDNVKDRVDRGRSAPSKGEDNNSSKLTESQIKEIRVYLSEGLTLKKIADMYSVHLSLISLIKNKKLWSHVQEIK